MEVYDLDDGFDGELVDRFAVDVNVSVGSNITADSTGVFGLMELQVKFLGRGGEEEGRGRRKRGERGRERRKGVEGGKERRVKRELRAARFHCHYC